MIHIVVGNRYKVERKMYASAAQNYLDQKGIEQDAQVNIIFVGKRKMTEIAAKYKNERVALPVLSFSYMSDPEYEKEKLIGEVYLCYPQVVLLAAEKDKSVDTMMIEMIEHGINNLLSN
ncbi:rRNA maturation RNAse YbeY [Candidatus Woesebacteria bacterium]|nr:rRNA maturation RNAse YbeY [Candidatus Woesebacteria bacterium]